MRRYLNDLTKEDYDQIKTLSKLFFTKKEVCIMLEIDFDDFEKELANDNSRVYLSYVGGFLQGELDLRMCISKLANSGSAPAQNAMLEINRKSKYKN